MSALAWIAFIICTIAVILHYRATDDTTFLLYAIPGLIMLLVIPMTLNWMSRKTFMEASEEHESGARRCKINRLDFGMIGTAVRITGTVKKVSFTWLMRPHFQVEDDTGRIRVIMFTTPAETITAGDTVAVLGLVMKNVFARKKVVISAVSIKKIV